MSPRFSNDWTNPEFLAWLQKRGQIVRRDESYLKMLDLYNRWLYELAEEEKSRARMDRAAIEGIVETLGPELRKMQGLPSPNVQRGLQSRQIGIGLARQIQRGWRVADPFLSQMAGTWAGKGLPLQRLLLGQHWQSDAHRWTVIRLFYLERQRLAGRVGPIEDFEVLFFVEAQEEQYQKTKATQETRARRAAEPGQQLRRLTAWARRQKMNLLDDFEPGIAGFVPSAASEYIEAGRMRVEQEDLKLVIRYDKGKPLRIPVDYIDFGARAKSKGLASQVEAVFFRLHKASGRLVPFAQYNDQSAFYDSLYNIDLVGSEHRWMTALPRIDDTLTPALMSYYSGGNFQLRLIEGLMKVITVSAGGPASRLVVRGTASLVKIYPLMRQTLRAPVATLQTAAITVQLNGLGAGGKFLYDSARRAYYLNAPKINETVVVGTEVLFELAGQDAGVSVSDMVVFHAPVKGRGDEILEVAAEVKRAIKGQIAVDIVSVADPPAGAVARGKKAMAGTLTGPSNRQAVRPPRPDVRSGPVRNFEVPRGPRLPFADAVPQGKPKKALLPDDPRPAVDIAVLDKAAARFRSQILDDSKAWARKFDRKAREKLANLSPEQLIEAQVYHGDLAALSKSLASAGKDVIAFVNRFHDVPGFEKVVLSWAQKHTWKGAKQGWKRLPKSTRGAFQSGALHVIRYCVAKNLDPALMRFEVPLSRSGALEMPARWTDLVLEGAGTTGSRKMLHVEFKSYAPRTIARSVSNVRGIPKQFVRDTAIVGPQDIRWVFDSKKLRYSRELKRVLSNDEIESFVTDAFVKVILGDDLLKTKWGKSEEAVRSALAEVIEVF